MDNKPQTCCVSVTTSTSHNDPHHPNHHQPLNNLDHHNTRSTSSSSYTIHSNPTQISFDPSSEIVRHTTKLLKSRDSRTGRLIINQYMKGKELGRGVHGIVYIGKNMDKLIRTSPYQNPFSLTHSSPLVGSEHDHHPTSDQFPDSHIPPNSSIKPSDAEIIHENSKWSDEDYETVAIKVVRREPKGPKSLRRSQIQRQQEREVQAIIALSNQIQNTGHVGAITSKGSFDLPSSGRVPLLKDVDDKLKKEIAIMKRLRHKHIVQLKEVIDDAKSKKVFMILEFMEGGQVLWQDPLTQTPLMTVEQARKTFRQVLLGLEYLHYQGIIHRDIKPANLLWTADRETVKISDFGVSHISGVLKRSASTQNLPANFLPEGLKDDSPRTTNSTDDKALRKTEGSPAFMAPELCCPVEITPAITPYEANSTDYFTPKMGSGLTKPSNSLPLSDNTSITDLSSISSRLISLPLPAKTFPPGERPVVGKAIDIWALGVTLFCLLFGRTPFNAPNEYELFNVIWNEPILIPDSMGIERQSLEFDPVNRHLDGPVQRDSRELVDLLRKLLEKDPRKRITLEDVKIHPWVLNNLDNTQYWVHETAPVGGDAVYVTTEEVANFSRPRASLTTHKPLFGVKESLRKAAIKLGLQRPSPKISRISSKSISSGASGSPTPQAETTFPSLKSRHSSLSSHSMIGPKMAVDTANLHSNFPQPESAPPIAFAPNASSSFKRSFGACSAWPSNLAPKSNTPRPLSVRPIVHSHCPISPTHSTTPMCMRADTPILKAMASTQSCLSSTSSRSGSPSHPHELSHSSALSVPSSSSNTPSFAPALHRSIHAHHLLLDPIGLSVDKVNHRRSLPSSPASIQASASLSRSSLVPPRATSPAAVSEGEYHAKLATPTWFRDALFSVRRRFARSPMRRHSHLTNLSVSDDLEHHAINDREMISSFSQTTQAESSQGSRVGELLDDLRSQGIGVERVSPSQAFSSDAELSCSHHDLLLRRDERVDPHTVDDEEDDQQEATTTAAEEEEEEDDDDDELGENLLQPPLMYHDGTNWTFPSEDSRLRNEEGINGDSIWMINNILNGQQHDQAGGQEAICGMVGGRSVGGVETEEEDEEFELGLSGMELTPRNVESSIGTRTSAVVEHQIPHTPYTPTIATNYHLVGQSSSDHHVPWAHPRLTFRPASIDDNERKLEYRSSDDDDDDEDEDSTKFRWKSSTSNSSGSIGFSNRELEIDYGSNNNKKLASTSTTNTTATSTSTSSIDHLSKINSNPTSPSSHNHLIKSPPQFLHKSSNDRDDDDDDEADNTLQIQVKPRKRGCSKSDSS